MPKRTRFTNITPLPASISRELAIAMVHNHSEMIELNPLVIDHHSVKAPRDAPADEFLDCVWYELTDKIQYLPGGLAKGKISYRGCFHDLPNGLQTHIYAPLGLDIREKWTVGGTLPGEPPEPRELGLDIPTQGLYLREDGDMRCNILMTGFVRKNLDMAHKVLVERILKKAERIEAHLEAQREAVVLPKSPGIQPGSYLSTSSFVRASSADSYSRASTSSSQQSNQQQPYVNGQDPQIDQHPAYRKAEEAKYSQRALPALPPYQASAQYQDHYSNDMAKQRPTSKRQQSNSAPKQFVAELPGSTPTDVPQPLSWSPNRDLPNNRVSAVSELSGSDTTRSPDPSSDRGSSVMDTPPGHYKYNPQDFVQAAYGTQYARRDVSAPL